VLLPDSTSPSISHTDHGDTILHEGTSTNFNEFFPTAFLISRGVSGNTITPRLLNQCVNHRESIIANRCSPLLHVIIMLLPRNTLPIVATSTTETHEINGFSQRLFSYSSGFSGLFCGSVCVLHVLPSLQRGIIVLSVRIVSFRQSFPTQSAAGYHFVRPYRITPSIIISYSKTPYNPKEETDLLKSLSSLFFASHLRSFLSPWSKMNFSTSSRTAGKTCSVTSSMPALTVVQM
jgi:hypothetical protein